MLKFALFALLLAFSLSFKPCQPWGTRIFYGKVVQDQKSEEKLQLYFNTAQQCAQSYVQLIKKSGLDKVQCITTHLQLSKNVNNYQTFIHKCSLNVNFEETFHYNIFGWDGSSSNPVPFSSDFIYANIADVTNDSRKINIITLADWSYLENNKGKYVPLDNLFASVLRNQEINGLMIGGDVGYDLDTNNCLNYEKFLVMLSGIAKTVPVIMVTGNHEYNTDDNYNLFKNSFQMYGLDTDLATNIQIGPLSLLPFDPFQIALGKKGSKDICIAKFISKLQYAKNTKKFIVPASHYPLACSGTSKNCKNDRVTLKAYWDAMIDAGVSLYIGAHYHTYQRVFPYLKNNTFKLQAGNYRTNQNYLISIVEGVAGNDKDIVESIDTIEDFTAAYTINQTGFGVLSIDQDKVTYTHHSTARGITDNLVIQRAKGNNNLLSE